MLRIASTSPFSIARKSFSAVSIAGSFISGRPSYGCGVEVAVAVGVEVAVRTGTGVGVEVIGTLTVGKDSAAGRVTTALGCGGGLISAVPTPYPYTSWPPKWA